jgi:hypothetical protein
MSEAPRGVAAAAELQQVAADMTAVMTMAIIVPSISTAPAPGSGSQVAVVEVPDEDTPPPGWDQWRSLPAPALEASSSYAVLPASDGTTARPEPEQEHVVAPPAHFADAQAEQALWQEFRDHGTSLHRALNEALRIHSGPVWRVFQVRDRSLSLVVPPLSFLPRPLFP